MPCSEINCLNKCISNVGPNYLKNLFDVKAEFRSQRHGVASERASEPVGPEGQASRCVFLCHIVPASGLLGLAVYRQVGRLQLTVNHPKQQ